MDKIKKNFGFGCMRFPMIGEKIDEAQVSQMVDYFLDQGFNYFDTAHGYIGERSELAVKNCLTSRYPRESYILTNKLTAAYFEKEEDIRPFFESQLERCGVDYFDFYLMHAQGMGNYPKFKECHAYETALTFKEEGKIRHFGISFHDRAEVLEQILTEYPQIEVVQIQFNYADFDDPAVQAGKCYEICRKHGKQVIVMEPVRGGSLANLPDDAKAVFEELHGGSPATYAIRYAAGFPGIMMVLSGMSSLEQMKENVSFMKDFRPLDGDEGGREGARDLPRKEPDPVYRMPLLCRRMSEEDLDSGSVCVHEREEDLPEYKFKCLLWGPYTEQRKSVGLYQVRKVREGMSAAS